MQHETLIKKIETLPSEALVEVENFVDFLQQKARRQNIKSRDEAIAEYAARHAGSEADLDEQLEQASAEFLSEEDE